MAVVSGKLKEVILNGRTFAVPGGFCTIDESKPIPAPTKCALLGVKIPDLVINVQRVDMKKFYRYFFPGHITPLERRQQSFKDKQRSKQMRRKRRVRN